MEGSHSSTRGKNPVPESKHLCVFRAHLHLAGAELFLQPSAETSASP